MHDILSLEFVDQVTVVGVGHKVDIDILVRHKVQVSALQELHIIIIYTNSIIRIVVFKYEEIAADLADDLEISAAAVLPFRLRVNDPLGR
jgi:hypothetical protein